MTVNRCYRILPGLALTTSHYRCRHSTTLTHNDFYVLSKQSLALSIKTNTFPASKKKIPNAINLNILGNKFTFIKTYQDNLDVLSTTFIPCIELIGYFRSALIEFVYFTYIYIYIYLWLLTPTLDFIPQVFNICK